jgi:hypothetical protein
MGFDPDAARTMRSALPLSCFKAILTEYQGLDVLGRAALQIRYKNMLSRKGVFSLGILDDAVAAHRIFRANEPKPFGRTFEIGGSTYQHVCENLTRTHVCKVSKRLAGLEMFAIPDVRLDFL